MGWCAGLEKSRNSNSCSSSSFCWLSWLGSDGWGSGFEVAGSVSRSRFRFRRAPRRSWASGIADSGSGESDGDRDEEGRVRRSSRRTL